jgi:hypothetical protein
MRLQFLERRSVFFAVTAKPVLLDTEISEIAAIQNGDLGLNEELALGGIGDVTEQFGALDAAEGVYAGFERGDAIEPPLGVSERLYEVCFRVSDWFKADAEISAMVCVRVGIIAWQQDGATG